MQTIKSLIRYPNGDGTFTNEYKRTQVEGGAGSVAKPEPFDIAFSVVSGAARATVSNLIFQVGNTLMETAGTAFLDMAASGYLWAKIDVSVAPYQVSALVAHADLDHFSGDEITESGKYYFKSLYKITKTGTALSVALDLRGSMMPNLS